MGGFIGKVQEIIFSPNPNPELIYYVLGIVMFVLMCVALGFAINSMVQQSRITPVASPENVALLQAKQQEAINAGTQLEGSNSWNGIISKLAPGERYLVNLCPLTASLGGWIGGDVNKGVFYSDFYLQKALRAGIRSFVLPICTYTDDKKIPPNWPMSGDPAVVARDKLSV